METSYDQITPTYGIPFLPKFCTIVEKITLWLIGPDEIICDTEAYCEKIPLSDCFYIFNRYILKLYKLELVLYCNQEVF